jgi:hypothetical protein
VAVGAFCVFAVAAAGAVEGGRGVGRGFPRGLEEDVLEDHVAQLGRDPEEGGHCPGGRRCGRWKCRCRVRVGLVLQYGVRYRVGGGGAGDRKWVVVVAMRRPTGLGDPSDSNDSGDSENGDQTLRRENGLMETSQVQKRRVLKVVVLLPPAPQQGKKEK